MEEFISNESPEFSKIKQLEKAITLYINSEQFSARH